MFRSIQEISKEINTRLSGFDCLSLGLIALFLAGLAFYIHQQKLNTKLPVLYKESSAQVLGVQADGKPFGSKNGTTYTYSWCSGSDNIKPQNKLVFASEEQAIASGRTLSKLCQK